MSPHVQNENDRTETRHGRNGTTSMLYMVTHMKTEGVPLISIVDTLYIGLHGRFSGKKHEWMGLQRQCCNEVREMLQHLESFSLATYLVSAALQRLVDGPFIIGDFDAPSVSVVPTLRGSCLCKKLQVPVNDEEKIHKNPRHP